MSGARSEPRKRLGDLLVEEGLIDRYQLQSALAEQRKWGGRLGRHLLDLGVVSEEVLAKALARLLHLPSVDVAQIQIPRAVIDYVPVKTAERFNLIPVKLVEAEPGGGNRRTLVVAMSDPTNLAALDELQFTSGCAVRAVVSGDASIERAIKIYYHGATLEELQGPPRHRPQEQESDHWEIVTSGDVRSIPKQSPTTTPLPVQERPGIDDRTVRPDPNRGLRRWNALLKILESKGVLTAAEIDLLEKL